MRIELDDLTRPQIAALLDEHLQDMRRISPPESKHALDLDGLRKPDISFWTVWDGDALAGCGALKELDPTHGEIKSMRVAADRRGRGVGADRLYRRFGFEFCGLFGRYREDPYSVFMTRGI